MGASTGARHPQVSLHDAIAFFAVLAISIKTVWGIGHMRDVYLNDESVYLASGVRMLVPGFPNDARGLPAPDWSPLYACWYQVLHWVVRDPVRLYDTSWSLLVVLVSTALYVLQRRLGASPLAALGAAFVVASARFFDFWPYPSDLAVLMFAVGLIVALGANTDRGAARVIVLVACASVFVRPELSITAGILAAWGAAVTIAEVRRTGRGRLAAPRDAVLVSAAAGLLFALFGDPVVSGRSFYAWGQHYAVTQAERGHLDVDPWINWTSLVQHDFGQVDTISGALRANPAAFARNVLHNAGELPSQLADTITPLGFLPQTPCMIVYTLLLVAGAIGVVGRWRRGGPTARPLKIVAVVWFCVGINALPGALIIQPRHHYLLLFSALSVALAAAGLADGLRVLLARGPERWRARMATWDHAPSTRAVAATAAMLFVLMPNRAYGACLQTAIGLVRKPRPDPHETARTAAALHALGIARKVVVLEQGYSYVFYSGLAFDRVREWTKDRPFGTWLHDNDISVVVLSEAIFRNGAFASDPEFIDFAYDPASFGFRPLPVLGTPNTFAIRDDIETTGAPR